jgi:hypothetical protein
LPVSSGGFAVATPGYGLSTLRIAKSGVISGNKVVDRPVLTARRTRFAPQAEQRVSDEAASAGAASRGTGLAVQADAAQLQCSEAKALSSKIAFFPGLQAQGFYPAGQAGSPIRDPRAARVGLRVQDAC